MSYVYLASPYTHQDPAVVLNRVDQVMRVTAHFLREGVHVFSPVVHCHELAQRFDLPTDFAFWQNYNYATLEKADEIWVIALDGWSESKGIFGELLFARDRGIRIKVLDPITFQEIEWMSHVEF